MVDDVQEQFKFRLEARAGYIFVWQHGRATKESEIASMQRIIERAMTAVGSRRLMFDNRYTEPPDEMIRAAMWSWMCAQAERVAMLQETVSAAKRSVRTAELNRVALKSFSDEREAEAWLMSSRGEAESA